MLKNPTSIIVASIDLNTSVAAEQIAFNKPGKNGANSLSIAYP